MRPSSSPDALRIGFRTGMLRTTEPQDGSPVYGIVVAPSSRTYQETHIRPAATRYPRRPQITPEPTLIVRNLACPRSRPATLVPIRKPPAGSRLYHALHVIAATDPQPRRPVAMAPCSSHRPLSSQPRAAHPPQTALPHVVLHDSCPAAPGAPPPSVLLHPASPRGLPAFPSVPVAPPVPTQLQCAPG